MSITNSQNRVSYAGNGVTTLFAVTFKFMAATDIDAVLVDTVSFVETPLVEGTDFTVTGADQPEGSGIFTATVAPPTGKTLVIWCDPAVSQGFAAADTQALSTSGLLDALDRITIIARRALDLAKRSIGLDDGFSGSFTPSLPVQIVPNAILIVDPTGTKVIMGPTIGSLVPGMGGTPIQEAPAGAVNNSNVTFTLSQTPAAAALVEFFVDGLMQRQGVGLDYTIAGSVITTSAALDPDSTGQVKIWAKYSY